MAKKTKTSEISNDMFICACEKSRLGDYCKPITQMEYTQDELIKIFDFYLSRALTIKNNGTKGSEFGLRALKELGWAGNAKLSSLERKLLQSAGIQRFVIMISSSIDATIKNMDLDGNICTKCPRAVLKLDCKFELLEDGSIKKETSETRMECLFRHIRNSIAHGHTYYFPNNETLLLEDCDLDSRITARILLKKSTLLDWIGIIDEEQAKTPISTEEKSCTEIEEECVPEAKIAG